MMHAPLLQNRRFELITGSRFDLGLVSARPIYTAMATEIAHYLPKACH